MLSLLGLPKARMVSLIPRSPGFFSRENLLDQPLSLSAVVHTVHAPPLVMDLVPLFHSSKQFQKLPLSQVRPVLSFWESGETAFLPFLKIYLTCSPDKNSSFYGELSRLEENCSIRVLSIGSCGSPAFGALSEPPFSGLLRLLTVQRSEELPKLADTFPYLKNTALLLEDYLRNQEISCLFRKNSFSAFQDTEGISAMCSLNRLLLKENRLSDLKAASQSPEALSRIFREFQEKGLL